MPYRTVKLPTETHDFVLSRVESGRYENACELLRAAFRALHREEQASEKTRTGRSVAENDVFRKLWEASAASSPISRATSEPSVSQ